MDIFCLHLHSINIAPFEAAAPRGARLTHFLRSDIRLRAQMGLHDTAVAEISENLARLGRTADRALLTCSSYSSLVCTPGQVSADGMIAASLARDDSPLEILYAIPAAEPNLRAVYAPVCAVADVTFTLVPHLHATTKRDDAAAQAALIDAQIADSRAERILILQAPLLERTPSDPRAIWGPSLALQALATTPEAQNARA
ncbi:hypothetical protein [Oceanibium sediminis]|uniref:hypothetical protein n=1 Tax=Oceanibium sediminis TaxID=2026339 RepID=UPI000DD3A75F|nr:hypothetical protein [Oceanibium sediminis]